MDFCQVIFGKSLQELKFADLQHFFQDPQDETATLEFKSYHPQATFDASLDAVIKGISAFLNSDGGVLIWGAPIGLKVDGKKEPVFQGALSLVNTLKEKDNLINIISGRIVPLPNGISVSILTDGIAYAYIFEVQASIYKPHQYRDTYYIRLDGQSKPAPHYLVQALFRQISYPNIEAFIKFVSITDVQTHLLLSTELYICNFSELENEEAVSYQLNILPGKFEGGSEAFFSKPIDVLYFGRPVINRNTIVFDKNALARKDNLFSMSCSIGGKKSPAKMSFYNLDFSLYDPQNDSGNLSYMVVSMRENVLFSDYQKEKGSNRQTFLSSVLGREAK